MREVREFVVRIFGEYSNNLPAGCGFLVGADRRYILTCCHVVNAALNRRETSKPSETVLLDFPFLAPKVLYKAEVDRWHYEVKDALHDICVLKLLDEIPVDAKPAPFVQADDYSGDAFRAFGFPSGFEDNGREVKGVLGAKQVNGRVLAEGISQFGYFIEQGFSGTPIWNSTRGGVCGMAFQVDTPVNVKVASIIPTEQLMRVSPDLLELSGVVPNYLRRLIADLESRRGVLQYVDLSGQTEVSNDYQNSILDIDDEFGFSELVQKPNNAQKEPIHLGKIRDVLDRHSRFVLIGDAGSSKTTTLRRLALEAARKRLVDDNAPLPLLLYLPRWESGLNAEEFINRQWIASGLAGYGDPIPLLKSGDVLLYLDGLNEMGGQGAENAKQLKSWLSSSNAPQYVVVTCRKDNYAGDFELGIPVVQIEPMSDEHIRQFVRNYIPDKAETLLKRILPHDNQSKQDKRHLYHLVRNPYMLAALIVVFDTSPQQELPRNNGKLMQMLVRALAKREARRNSMEWIPFDEKLSKIEQALANLAFSMIAENTGTEVSIEYVGKFVEQELLHATKSANLVQITETHLRFYHQLIQEYFAALHLINRDYLKLIPKSEPLVTSSYGSNWTISWDERWGWVFIDLVGLSTNPNQIIKQIGKENVFLAADCCLSMNLVDKEILDSIKIILQEIYDKGSYHAVIPFGDVRSKAPHYYTVLRTLRDNTPYRDWLPSATRSLRSLSTSPLRGCPIRRVIT